MSHGERVETKIRGPQIPDPASGKESTYQYRRHKRREFSPWVGRSLGGAHDNPLQYSCLENPMDRGAWWATVHGVAET